MACGLEWRPGDCKLALTGRAINESGADFFDLHSGPRPGGFNVAETQAQYGATGYQTKPLVIGELAGFGAHAPQHIEIDLGAVHEIGAVRLTVAQWPAGATTHRQVRSLAGRRAPRPTCCSPLAVLPRRARCWSRSSTSFPRFAT